MAVKLFWNAMNGQGNIEMGEYFSYSEAMLAIPAARAELYENCMDEDQTADVAAGIFSIGDEEI